MNRKNISSQKYYKAKHPTSFPGLLDFSKYGTPISFRFSVERRSHGDEVDQNHQRGRKKGPLHKK